MTKVELDVGRKAVEPMDRAAPTCLALVVGYAMERDTYVLTFLDGSNGNGQRVRYVHGRGSDRPILAVQEHSDVTACTV